MPRTTLMLSMTDLKGLVSMEECITLQREAFAWHTEGKAYNSPNAWLRLRGRRTWMKLLAGFIEPHNVMVVKAGARLPHLPSGRNVLGLTVLFDAEDGYPVAVMDAAYITALRTGAGGGLAAQHLARPDSRVVGILGTGVQARFNLWALRAVLPNLVQVMVYSRSEANRCRFAEQMEEQTGLPMQAVGGAEVAVRDADVVVTATNSPDPVLLPEWLRPGMHVNLMGIKYEVDPRVFRGAKVVVDGKSVALDDGKVSVAIAAGAYTPAEIYAELGEVVLGRKPGRTGDQEVTLFDSSGLPAQDGVMAVFAYRKALERGIGQPVALGLDEET